MAKPTQTKREPNPTVAAMFEDQRWGGDEEGNPNFISTEIDAKGYDVLANIQIGDKLLLKRTNKTSKNGNKVTYLEVIKDRRGKGNGKAQTSQADEI